jgi:hypothetical protein
MGGAGLVLKTVKGNAGPGNADYSIPVGIDWEHYRENRPGYVSNLTLRISPFWEHRLDNGSLGLFADARLEDCYGHDNGRLDADSLDAVLARATLSSERRFPLFSVSSEFSFSGDRYLSDKRREKRDVYEPVVRISAGHDGKPRSDLEVRYEWERNQRVHTLTGDRLRLLARGEIPLNPGWSVRPGFLYEDRSAPLKKVSSPASGEDYFLYLWEAFSALEPLAGVSFQRKKGGLFLSGSFRYEDVTENKAYFLKDSRTWKATGNGEWRFLERWLLIASGEYQYRIYSPFDSNSRQTSNLSVSASVSTRF